MYSVLRMAHIVPRGLCHLSWRNDIAQVHDECKSTFGLSRLSRLSRKYNLSSANPRVSRQISKIA